MFLTDMADVLRSAGLRVDEMAGWQRVGARGRGLNRVDAIVCHHTASSADGTSMDRILRHGHSTLSGPLSQLGLRRNGTYVAVAAGRCNHNGYGQFGNDTVGIEAYNDGISGRWPGLQVSAFIGGARALAAAYSVPTSRILGHKETDPDRKIDPFGIDMDWFRRHVDAAPTQEGDDMLRLIELAYAEAGQSPSSTDLSRWGFAILAKPAHEQLAGVNYVRLQLGLKAL